MSSRCDFYSIRRVLFGRCAVDTWVGMDSCLSLAVEFWC
jgi:hypothetical protein